MKALIASLILLLSSTANAMNLIEYRDKLNSESTDINDYITGLANGYEWNQSYLISKGLIGKKTFCVQNLDVLDSNNMMKILNQYLSELVKEKGKDTVDYYSIELVLLWALEREYPCQN